MRPITNLSKITNLEDMIRRWEEKGLKRLKLSNDVLEVEFFPSVTHAPAPSFVSPSLPDAINGGGNSPVFEEEVDISPELEQEIREHELAELAITDPVEFEKVMLSDDLTPEKKDEE